MHIKFEKRSVINFLVMFLFLSAFVYSINDSKREIDSKNISHLSGVISFQRPVGARTFKVIVTDSINNKQLKFLCYKDFVSGYLRSGSYCFSESELIEMKGKQAVVAWYSRNVGLLLSRKQILSISTLNEKKYVIAKEFVKNEVWHVFMCYLLFLPAILFFVLSKNAFRKRNF